MKFSIIAGILLMTALIAAGCFDKSIGGETDEHGCIIGAGYSWCESESKCLRIWEGLCPGTKEYIAQYLCDTPNAEGVYICGDYVQVVSSLPGQGSVFYKTDGTELSCPVVAPDSMSSECRTMVLETDCSENVCRKEAPEDTEDQKTKAVDISRQEIEKSELYMDNNGTDLLINNAMQGECEGCWQVFAQFDYKDKNSLTRRVDAKVTLDAWQVAGYKENIRDIYILTSDACENRNGRMVNTADGTGCMPDEIRIAEIEGFMSPTICCVPKAGAQNETE
ncbi:MAG: hypothetical protein KKE20_06405, partial [Nanoarchaeota archaeon]|nr:hypothetical protein [Nanoarchaeota archaeon]